MLHSQYKQFRIILDNFIDFVAIWKRCALLMTFSTYMIYPMLKYLYGKSVIVFSIRFICLISLIKSKISNRLIHSDNSFEWIQICQQTTPYIVVVVCALFFHNKIVDYHNSKYMQKQNIMHTFMLNVEMGIEWRDMWLEKCVRDTVPNEKKLIYVGANAAKPTIYNRMFITFSNNFW